MLKGIRSDLPDGLPQRPRLHPRVDHHQAHPTRSIRAVRRDSLRRTVTGLGGGEAHRCGYGVWEVVDLGEGAQ